MAKELLLYVPVNYETLIRGMSQFTGTKLITAADLLFVLSKMEENIRKKTQELNLPLQNFRLMLLPPRTHECYYATVNSFIQYYKLIETDDKNKNRKMLPISCKVNDYVKNANAQKNKTIDGFEKAQHRNMYICEDYPVNLSDWSYTNPEQLLDIIHKKMYEMQFVCPVATTAKERNQLRQELIQHIASLFTDPTNNNPPYFPLWGVDKTIKSFRFSTDKEENDLIWQEVLVSAIENYKHSGAIEINQREIPLSTHVFKTSEDVLDSLKYGTYEGQDKMPELIDMIERIRTRQKAGEYIPPPTIDDTNDRTF